MGLEMSAGASGFLHGALGFTTDKDGWVRPSRFAPEQLRAVGSVRAWHPGLYRQLAVATAGVCLEMETDATRLALEVRVDPTPRGAASVLADVERHPHGPRPPFDGVSAVVDGRRLPLALPDEKNLITWLLDNPASGPEPGLQHLPGMGEPHHVRVWLPCLTSCAVRSVTCDGTYLEPVAARRQLVVLGDSVAQGFVARDPSRSWCALLAERLGLDLVNQGLGGQVFQPGSLVGLPERVDAAGVVVEFGENYRYEPCQAARVERDVRTYLYELAEGFPDAPIWVLTCPPHTEDVYPTHPRSCAAEVDAIVRAAAGAHAQMRLVEAAPLLDADRLPELLADGSDHPGPLGQEMMAERLSFVVDATRDDPAARRERALQIAEGYGDDALPLAECLRRGAGQVLLAEKGAVVVGLSGGMRIVAGPSRRLVRRALTCLGAAGGTTCVCGKRALAREVARAFGGRERACHVVVWRGGEPPTDPSRDIRVLTPAYAGVVRERYAHPEYLAPGELEAALEAGKFLGGFEAGRIVGFVGEHEEGSMGMLEVFEGHRREGWGTALAAAKVAAHLAAGELPWAEVWPENDASLALERAMGFEVRPADALWFVS